MNQNVILYTNNCPRCKELKFLLDRAKIIYEVNTDMNEMISKGFMSVPILEVDGTTMNYEKAKEWIEERKAI